MPIICKGVRTRSVHRGSSIVADQPNVYQDYGFDYSDDGEGQEAESADVENMYYTAKCTQIFPYCRHGLIPIASKKRRRSGTGPEGVQDNRRQRRG